MTEVETNRARRTIPHLRYVIVFILFFVTAVNYADRSALSITGDAISKDWKLDPAALGIVFSAFGWSYVLAQLPGGWLLDRFGSKKVYGLSILLWSLCVFLQGFSGIAGPKLGVPILFVLGLLLGFAEAPAFPGNSRIVAAWFPTKERGTAAAIFNSAQYAATVFFAPLMGTITTRWHWPWVFWSMGLLGLVVTVLWFKFVQGPQEHPWMSTGELEYIEKNGALVTMDQKKAKGGGGFTWETVKFLLTNRMLVGVYIGQFCITTLTYFFITWFPVYLVQQRHMSILKVGFVAVLPAVCGCIGGFLGGIISDFLLRRTNNLTFARKTPIVVGMLVSCTMVACNYVTIDWLVIGFMCIAYFGKGVGALGWTVVADTSPKEIMGVCGGLFNMFGNTAAITTALAVGFLVQYVGFNAALVFVAANALSAIAAYLFIVPQIRRLELPKPGDPTGGFPAEASPRAVTR